MKTKWQVLEANGWTCIVGYQFDYGKTPDQSNIIISKEEIEAFLKQKPELFFINQFDDEYSYDEDSAWDALYNKWCDDNLEDTMDIDIEDWTKKMLED